MTDLLRESGPTRFERVGGRGKTRDRVIEVDADGHVVGGMFYGNGERGNG